MCLLFVLFYSIITNIVVHLVTCTTLQSALPKELHVRKVGCNPLGIVLYDDMIGRVPLFGVAFDMNFRVCQAKTRSR